MRERCAGMKMVEVPEISVTALRELKEMIAPLCCAPDVKKIRAEENQKEARPYESQQAEAAGFDLERGVLLGISAGSDPATDKGVDRQATAPGSQQGGGKQQ